jgi:FixJ family two-component response regulator
MVYRSRKYIVLFGSQPGMLRGVAGQLDALLRRFGHADECLRYLGKCNCDLFVVDLEETGTQGLEVLSEARRMCPWLAVLALVGPGSTSGAVEAMKRGAAECLEKPAAEYVLRSAVERELSRVEPSDPDSIGVLTPAELKIVGMVLAGRTSKEIATALKRSKRTIDAHRSGIMHKLRVSSLVELAQWAISKGFAPPRSGGDDHPGEPSRPTDTPTPA